MSLDFLIKGNMTHAQVKHFEASAPDSKAKALMREVDIKYPILLGDQFHTKAYYLTSRLGSNDMCSSLSAVEESFSKINFRGEAAPS